MIGIREGSPPIPRVAPAPMGVPVGARGSFLPFGEIPCVSYSIPRETGREGMAEGAGGICIHSLPVPCRFLALPVPCQAAYQPGLRRMGFPRASLVSSPSDIGSLA